MKKTVFIVLFLQSIYMWAQITLPIQQSNIPKNHLVVNYDFSKGTSYSGIGATVTNLSNFSASDNATLVNTPSFSSSFGYIYLNGYNHYLLSPNLKPYFKSVTATNLQDSHTLSLWICPVASSGVVVNELGSTDINSGFRDSQIEMVNGYVKFRVYPAGESDRITSLSTIALNQWHHIAMVYDGATAKGYVDGVLQGTKTYTRTNPINNNTNLHYSIGAPCVTHMGSGAAGNFFLAQFKMYNIPLTGTDIMQEFTRENPNFQNKWIPTSFDVFSPSTNSNPKYWSVSTVWPAPVSDTFNESPSKLHYTPWINSPQGWSAQVNNLNQYTVLNYHRPTTIAGIVTQGRANNGGQWVSKAHVEVSLDGSTWTRVLTDVVLNYDSLNTVTVLFPSTVYAKYVKVIPTDWIYHITMRLGIIVKPAPIVTNGLVLQLDAADLNSYSETGTTWTDISGSTNNGLLNNGPVFNSGNGGHFILDGVNDVLTGTAITSTSGNNSRTVMGWYKSNSFANIPILDKGSFGANNTAEQFFVAAENSAGDTGFYPPTNPGGIYVAFWGNDIYYPIPAATLYDGNWHFIAYTYNSIDRSVSMCFDGVFASMIYYMDGTWKTLNSKPFILSSALNTSNNSYLIGQTRAKLWARGSEFGNSRIAAVSIYNRSLTEQEILTNFNALKSRYGM